MKNLICSAALICAALSGTTAGAATLGLNVNSAIAISGLADVSNETGGFGLSVFGDGAATASGFDGLPFAFTAAGLVEPGFFEGVLLASDFVNTLEGVLIAAGFTGTDADDGTDVIELLFGNLDQTLAALFGPQALLTLVGEFGATPFETDFSFAGASATINPVAPVPLPATLPLLAGALGAGALLRRRARG